MKWQKITTIPEMKMYNKNFKNIEGIKMYSKVFRNYLQDCNEDALVLPDEYAMALVGVAHQFNKALAIYDSRKVIEIIMENLEIDDIEARDYFEYNIKGSYVGDNTPLFLDSLDDIILGEL